MKHTPQQIAFIEALRSSSNSIALMARAGSGKTTTMVYGAKECNLSGLCVAFNKLIADELSKKMPPSMLCKTMNGLGHGAWGKHLGKRLILNTEKVFQIAGEVLPSDLKRDFMGDFMRLVNLFRTLPVLPNGAPGASHSDDERYVWLDLIEEFDLDFGNLREERVIELARKMLLECIKRAWAGEIDFSDQLYMPVVYRSRFDTYPNVLVDEAQDLSPLQHKMIERCIDSSSRVIVVGDPNQAIYAWRGASSDSFQIMAEQFKCEIMPLTVSFRCSQAVIKEAQKFVPDIQFAEGASLGSVVSDMPFSKREMQHGDWIICRNNRPLVQAFFELAKRQIPAKIRGRQMGPALIKLVDKISGENDAIKATDFLGPLGEYSSEKCRAFNEVGKFAKAQDLFDRCEVIGVICENVPKGGNLQMVKMRLSAMFDDSGGTPITLSSIHKAKGLEAKRVHFLDPGLIPSKWAKGDALRQEYNLSYVAITRAQEELTYVTSEEQNHG